MKHGCNVVIHSTLTMTMRGWTKSVIYSWWYGHVHLHTYFYQSQCTVHVHEESWHSRNNYHQMVRLQRYRDVACQSGSSRQRLQLAQTQARRSYRLVNVIPVADVGSDAQSASHMFLSTSRTSMRKWQHKPGSVIPPAMYIQLPRTRSARYTCMTSQNKTKSRKFIIKIHWHLKATTTTTTVLIELSMRILKYFIMGPANDAKPTCFKAVHVFLIFQLLPLTHPDLPIRSYQ